MHEVYSNGTPELLTKGDFTEARDPFSLFELWFADARAKELNDPNAMALATAGADLLPNVRVVLLKGVDPHGFVFYTNSESQKGGELEANPQAALVFHWKSLNRQVRVRGHVEHVSSAESDAYFASRPRDSQIAAWASQQSRALDLRSTFDNAITEIERRYEGKPVPRPPHWFGYRVVPQSIEFWHDRPFRKHDRIVFSRSDTGSVWVKTRLFP
jgi:pyridoxamine 5'-phosphate oxidase